MSLLTDGEAGVRNGGRTNIDGQPSVISYYLGSPKTIWEVGVYSFHCDARSNQDYEVRFANNSSARACCRISRKSPAFQRR